MEPLFEVTTTAAVWAAAPITREVDWSDVRPRLAELARRTEAAKIFGAVSHAWASEPPLTAGELAELESQLGAELPAEYRSFLLEVSRGGAGPAYGLFPLRRVDGRWEWQGDGASRADDAALTRPFGHIRAFNPLADRPTRPEALQNEDAAWETHDDALHAINPLADRPTRPEALQNQNTAGETPDDALHAFNPLADRPTRPEALQNEDAARKAHDDALHSQGLLNLCDLGCALYEALVLSGPSRGQMWADDTADGGGFRPLQNPDGSRMTFADWYRQWLNESTAQIGGPAPDNPEGHYRSALTRKTPT
jgi:hypothetical protein